MAFCSNCGHELAENAKFCSNCGASTPYTEAPKTEAAPKEPERTVNQGGYYSYTPSESGGEYKAPVQETQSNEYKAPEREYNTWQSAAAPIEEPVKKSGGAGPIIGIIVGVLIIAAALVWIFMSGKGETDFAGYWKCVSVKLGGNEISGELGDYIDVENLYGLMLKDDNTFEMEITGETDLITGTWEAEEGGISMTADGVTTLLDFTDNKLAMDLSESGMALVVYFERVGKTAPPDFGVFEEENPTPANTPGPSSGGGEASREFGYFDIEILGGEPAEDDYDKNCFRIYYKFTNRSHNVLAPSVEVGSQAFQNGKKLDTVYLISDVREDDYDYCHIMPDTSIICTVSYKLEDESPLEVHLYDDYASPDDYVAMTFNVTENTGGFRNDFPLVTSPQWTNVMDSSYDWDDISCRIIGIGPGESIFGDELVKVNLEFTNNGSETVQISELVAIEVYQDNVEMFSGYLDEVVNDFYYDLAPGETVTATAGYELRSDSPVVVLVYNWESAEYIGDTFKLDW